MPHKPQMYTSILIIAHHITSCDIHGTHYKFLVQNNFSSRLYSIRFLEYTISSIAIILSWILWLFVELLPEWIPSVNWTTTCFVLTMIVIRNKLKMYNNWHYGEIELLNVPKIINKHYNSNQLYISLFMKL